jgi:hypothetical protein
MEHDDKVGEAISEGEADYWRNYIYSAISAHADWMKMPRWGARGVVAYISSQVMHNSVYIQS